MNMKKSNFYVFLLAAILTLVGCEPQVKYAIALDTNALALNVRTNATYQLTATVTPEDAAVVLEWTSSNAEVATVDENGLVTALAEGVATITVSAAEAESAQCQVTVINEVPASFPRKFLIEHFTGEECGYCPGGMYAIAGHITAATTPYIWVSHHYGYGNDEYTISANSKIGKFLGVSGAPNMALNRTKQQLGLTFHPGYLPEIPIADDTIAEASVVINHTYDAASRQLQLTVSGLVADTAVESYLLSVLIKENKLIGQQADYEYSWKTAKWKEYLHVRTVRDFVTAALGDTVYVKDQAYSHTMTYTVKNQWVAENCCIVAYLTPLNKKPIINAEQAPLVVGTTGGEESVPMGITESKAPNSQEKLTYDSVAYSKPSNDKLLVTMFSKTSVRTDNGPVKAIITLDCNTTAAALSAGTMAIQADDAANTIKAGYLNMETYTIDGSVFQYVDGKKLEEGEIFVHHTWKLASGNAVVDEQGDITITGNFDNGQHFTIKPAAAK